MASDPLEQAAQAMRAAVVQSLQDTPLSPWEQLHPSEQDRYRQMVRAALPVIRRQTAVDLAAELAIRREQSLQQWGSASPPLERGRQMGLAEAIRLIRAYQGRQAT